MVVVPFAKVCIYNVMRPLCEACKRKFSAVNYRKNDVTHYRKRCDSCIRKNKRKKPAEPKWTKAGYKKKLICDRCKFRAKSAKQTLVYHRDGDLSNCSLNNLTTICLNCSVEIMMLDLPWALGDLIED